RDIADAIFKGLDEREIAVFYDKNEQHRILAEHVEEYLRPIYQSEASFADAGQCSAAQLVDWRPHALIWPS
ncbi:MAG TPA: hypothetical protein VEP66_09800, partial [Myxococcales bacterium]|nr:hypothetical protein [Myxococcales bacterium]